MRPAPSPRRNGGTIGGPALPLPILCILSIHVNIPPLSFPHTHPIWPYVGMWQLQDLPGAPGTARQGPTRIIMLVNSGGTATQPRAPGHERPRAALRAARHGRLSAALRAPGADVPPATAAGAPGQYWLSAALRAPGHGRPSAAPRAAGHDRLSAELPAPGVDVPPATTAGAPGQHRLRAAPIATVALPAGPHRLRQEGLPRTPATPNTLTYPHSHRDTVHACTTHSRTLNHHSHRLNRLFRLPQRHSRASGNPRPPVATGGPQGGQPQSTHPTINQVQPAIQVPPRPRSCSTAGTGFPLHHPSRAPPTPARRKPILVNRKFPAPPGDRPSPPLELAPGEG